MSISAPQTLDNKVVPAPALGRTGEGAASVLPHIARDRPDIGRREQVRWSVLGPLLDLPTT
jgi:hypothetical protein